MEWKRLEYGKWPKGFAVFRFEVDYQYSYMIATIERDPKTNDWIFSGANITVDSVYDLPIYFIDLPKNQTRYN